MAMVQNCLSRVQVCLNPKRTNPRPLLVGIYKVHVLGFRLFSEFSEVATRPYGFCSF